MSEIFIPSDGDIDKVLSGEIEISLMDLKSIIEYELGKLWTQYCNDRLDIVPNEISKLRLLDQKLVKHGIYIKILGLTEIKFLTNPSDVFGLESTLSFYESEIEKKKEKVALLNRKVRLI